MINDTGVKNFWGSAMGDLYGVDVSATGPVLHVVYLCGPTSAGSGPELESVESCGRVR